MSALRRSACPGWAGETWRTPPFVITKTAVARVESGDGRLSFEGGDRISAPLAMSSARARDQQSAARESTHQPCQQVPLATPRPGARLAPTTAALWPPRGSRVRLVGVRLIPVVTPAARDTADLKREWRIIRQHWWGRE